MVKVFSEMHLKVFDDIHNATQRLSDASRRLPERFVDGCFGQPNFYRQNSPSRCFIKKKIFLLNEAEGSHSESEDTQINKLCSDFYKLQAKQ